MTLRVGDLIDLDEVGGELVAAGYERVDQVEDRGQFAIRGGILDVYPATEDRAIRVDLFDIEIESLRWFSTFTQRSLGESEAVEIAPSAELAAEHRELAEIAALEDDVRAPTAGGGRWPSCCPSTASTPSSTSRRPAPPCWSPRRRRSSRRWPTTGRTSAPRSTTTTPATSTCSPRPSPRRSTRARCALSALQLRPAGPAPRPGRRTLPRARCARRSPSSRSSCARATARWSTWPRRGEGERAAYNLARLRAELGRRRPGGARASRRRTLRDGFVAAGLKLAVIPEHRLFRRRRAERREDRRAARRAALVHRPADRRLRRPRGPRRRALRRLRDEDGRGRHARLPRAGVRRDRQGLHARSSSWRRSAATSGAGAGDADAVQARRQGVGDDEGPRAARRAGARRRAAQPLRRAPAPQPATPSPEDSSGCASSRRRSPTARRPTSATRSRLVKDDMEAPAADGPTRLRRRRLRQDRGRAAGGVQGGGRRAPGARARPDDDPRPAARGHLRGAPQGLPLHDRAGQPLPPGQGAEGGDRRVRRGQGRHPHRHAPAAQPRRARQGPRAASSSTRSSASASSRRSCCASSSSRSTSSR